MFDSKLEFQDYFNNGGDVEPFCNSASVAKLIALGLEEILELVLEKSVNLIEDYDELFVLTQLALMLGNTKVIKAFMTTYPVLVFDHENIRNWSKPLKDTITSLTKDELNELISDSLKNSTPAPISFSLSTLNLNHSFTSADEIIELINQKLKLNSNFGHRAVLSDILVHSELSTKQVSLLAKARSARHLTHFEAPDSGFIKHKVQNYLEGLVRLADNSEVEAICTRFSSQIKIINDEEIVDMLNEATYLTFSE